MEVIYMISCIHKQIDNTKYRYVLIYIRYDWNKQYIL